MAVGDPPFWLHYAQAANAPADDPWQGEPSDRYADAGTLWEIALACLAEAQAGHDPANTANTSSGA
jgi:hypothetical protein